MKKLTYKQARKDYLQTLYDMSNGEPYQEINLSKLHSKLQSSNSQQLGFMAEQKIEGLVDYPSFGIAMITTKGVIEVEEYSEEFTNKESQLPNNMLSLDELKQKSERFLITLFCLADGETNRLFEREKIFDIIGVHNIDAHGQIIVYINDKGLVDWSNNRNIAISLKGKIEIKKLMDSTYAEREFRVLEAIYELGNRKPEVWVFISNLAKSLEMPFEEINPILNDLERRKRLIGSVEEAVWILPAGIEEIEKIRKHPEEPTSNFPANVTNITNNINAPIGNLQQLSNNSSQSFTQIHAPSSVPDDLAGQIALLREELKKIARVEEEAGHDTSDYDEAIGAVTSARKALTEGNEAKAKSYLLSSGKFVADFASKIGVNLVTELIKQNTGI